MQETIDYIEGKVMPLVYKATFWKDRSINLYSNFRYDIGFDSLDFIGFIIEVEKEFGVHITDEEREDIKTPEDLINLVFEKTR
ncbi:acyl carrier protein [Parabacteroides goldsteinii]|uniref:acyl carrier protein n=1 Tax=Parabacteroides goldsteinii TaxID=328812 RepID=UPI00272C1695|nr:phosphopantetheine-binding protein [Parabacteroides goldsteinii]